MTYYNYAGVAMLESAPAPPASKVNGTTASYERLQAPPGPSLVNAGGGQNDLLIGNQGDNTFIIGDGSDIVQVASGLSGVKTILSYGGYALPDNVQNLTMYGGYQYALGNSLDNLIIVGDDDGVTLDGGVGNDVLVGGFGHDTFVAAIGEGNDVIYNFSAIDAVRLTGTSFMNFGQVTSAMRQVGADVVLQIDPTETLTFRGTTIASFTASNFLLKFDPSVLGAMTFDDEFNSFQPYNFSTHTGNWRTDFGKNWMDPNNYALLGNAEKQVYATAGFQGTAPAPLGVNPFSIDSGGDLNITASLIGQNSQYAFGQPVASGMINTKGIFEQQYGYFEMKASLPNVPGLWPAFWMVPEGTVGQELDIMESIGLHPNYLYSRAYGPNIPGTAINALKTGDISGMHTYGALWTPTTVTWYYDGYAVGQTATPSSWNAPMFMIINLAAGGWGGDWKAGDLPAGMKIDYVHAYALAAGGTVVQHLTPASPGGTITATDAGTVLVNAGAWTDAEMLANGTLVVAASKDSGYGSHVGIADMYNSATGAQIGNTISLGGYSPGGADMIPRITPLDGGFWKVTYTGAGGPTGFEVYNAQGATSFVDNQYTQGHPVFTPMVDSGWVITNADWGRFAIVQPDGRTDWFTEATVNGAERAPDVVDALSNSGFVFTYAGSTQLDVYDASGQHHTVGHLGAANSTFAMASAQLPAGDFAVAWLAPPSDGSFNMQLTFQTFDSTGKSITAATSVALDADPWHTQMKVIATGQPDQALLMWSQGGAVWGALADGSSIGTPKPLIVGSLDQLTETALTDGKIAITFAEVDGGVNELWVEVLDPKTMIGVKQELGAYDSGVHLVALAHGGFAASWRHGSEFDARAYDGHGDYGAIDVVSGDFLGVDASGHIVAVGHNAAGAAVLQHYDANLTGY